MTYRLAAKFYDLFGSKNDIEFYKELALKRNKLTVETANMIRDAGITVEIVSAGSTGTYIVTGTYLGITEIQPGSFVFGVGVEGSGYGFKTVNDTYFQSSLSVLTQVIGSNFSNRVVTDAGLKVMSSGFGPPLVKMNGERLICEGVSLSEEHGTIFFKEKSEFRKRLRWGHKLEFIPSHCCTCINQHDKLFVVKDQKLAAVWPITARGKYY